MRTRRGTGGLRRRGLRRRDLAIAAGAVCLFAGPLLADLALGGWTRVFRYFAGDAFLYFAVGRNAAAFGSFSIDQLHPTNGFHPLWQGFVALLYRVGEASSWDEPRILVTAFFANVLAIAVAIALVCRAQVEAAGRLPVSFLFLPLGFYGLAALPLDTAFGPRGSLWGFANGMESAFSLLLYAALMLAMVRNDATKSRGGALLAGGLLAALLLARLDNVFLGISVCAVLGLHALIHRDAQRFGTAALVGVPVLVTLGAYVAVNLATVGIALPVSGMAKVGAPDSANLQLLFRVLAGDLRESGVSWRLAQVLLPILVAAGALIHLRGAWRMQPARRIDLFFLSTALFVFLLGLHDLLLVPLAAQGHWYFPISILFASLFPLHVLDGSDRLRFLDSPAAALGWSLLVVGVFVRFYAGSDAPGPRLFADFVTRKVPELEAFYGESRPKILSFDDGIIAYGTGWPVMTWRGFMLDAEAIEYLLDPDASLLQLAYDRGFDRLASVSYFRGESVTRDMPSRRIARRLNRSLGPMTSRKELDRFSFEIEFLSRDGQLAVIRMRPSGRS